jgi:hypothetical protein
MRLAKKNYSIFILGPDSRMLLRDALKKHECFYFDPESNDLPWNIKVLWYTLFYFFKLTIPKGSLRSLVKSAYLAALVRVVARDILITAIDNNPHVFRVARQLHDKIRFLVIQNGMKLYDNSYLYPEMGEIFIPELICFGKYDENKILNSLARVKRFHLLGSSYELKSRETSELYQNFKNGNRDIEYDVCLISEDFTGWNDKFSGLEEASGKIAEFCYHFCLENQLKLVVALKNPVGSSKRESEIKFLSRFIDLNDSNITLSENKSWLSSYDVSIESHVSVGMVSSLLFENASRGLKVLVCDCFSKDWSFGNRQPLIMQNRELSYSKFKSALDQILGESHAEYYEKRSEQISYFVSENAEINFANYLRKLIESS